MFRSILSPMFVAILLLSLQGFYSAHAFTLPFPSRTRTTIISSRTCPRNHNGYNFPSYAISKIVLSIQGTTLTRLSPNAYNFESDNENELYLPKENKSDSTIIDEEEVDIAIVGAGIGGLCAGAILNTLYGKKVGIYESHYLPGGCAHSFDRFAKVPSTNEKQIFTFDSGPTIVLGCSQKPYNPLRQILNAVGVDQHVEWIRYDGWGMVEFPGKKEKGLRWKVPLGPNVFEEGPLTKFGGEEAVQEFSYLSEITRDLVAGPVEIPAMAGRSDSFALLPLLRYFKALVGLIQKGDLVTGTFAPYMDGPIYKVKNQWFRDWLDALAFSLSGLPANRTAASAMAYVLFDMHREGAALDYPKGGLGTVIDALVKGVEQGGKSKVNLRSHVKTIDTTKDGKKVLGVTLESGKKIKARDGVICNAPIWSIRGLMGNEKSVEILNNLLPLNPNPAPRQTWKVAPNEPSRMVDKRPISYSAKNDDESEESLLSKLDYAEMTGSFLHLHLALDAKGLDLDGMEAHYTVMARGLSGDDKYDENDGPCGELNMIAVSNPCVIDRTLAPAGYIVVHAYGAGNEPYDVWAQMSRSSKEYKDLKEKRASVLWEAVESIIPDARERVVTDLIGSPITHERFLRRPRGTYGAATEDYLKDGSTPIEGLVLCGDGIFPGIGVPAVAYSGASAANAMIGPLKHWKCLDELKRKGLI